MCQNFVDGDLADVRNHLAELPNCRPSIVYGIRLRVPSWTLCIVCVRVLCLYSFLRRSHTVGNKRSFLAFLASTWRNVFCTQKKRHRAKFAPAKSVGAPVLTAAKTFASRRVGRDGDLWVGGTLQVRETGTEAFPVDCSASKTLFYGQPSCIINVLFCVFFFLL